MKITVAIIAFVLLSTNAFFYWLTYEPSKEYTIGVDDERNQEYVINNYRFCEQYNRHIAKNITVFFGNDSINKINIIDFIKDKMLVFQFSGRYCEGCNSFVIKKLLEHFDNYANNDKIVLLGSEISPRLKDNFYGKKLLSYYADKMLLPFEKFEFPILYILDKNGVASMIFLPNKGFPEYTDNYLKIVKEMLQETLK
jgi:hypothetical protein